MRSASIVAILALVLAAPAAAAPAPKVSGIDTGAYPTIRFSVVTPAPSAVPPTVRENGNSVVGLETENLASAKSIVLAIDRSRSMNGTALANAVAAARQFVASKAPADRIGLVAFGRQAVRLTGFSSSTIDVDAALAGLSVDDKQGTALYDAVSLGARALGAEALAGRVLIVLTDGDDVSSRTSLAKAAAHAKRAGAAVYAIGIEGTGFSPTALRELARVSGGSYFPASSGSAVAGAYSSISDELRRTWRVTYLTTRLPGESVRVETTLGDARAAASVRMPGETSGALVEPKSASPLFPAFLYENGLGTFLLALIVGSCVILAVGILISTPAGVRLRRRLEPHTAETRRRKGKATPRERFAAASGVMTATEKALAHLQFWVRLHRLIERADLPLRTVEFFYICVGAGVGLGLIAAVAAFSPLVILGAMALGGASPILFAVYKAKKRLSEIEEQLPDLLITIAASLKAGHSFRQGLQAVVDEGRPPAATEFKRVLTETSLGRPMDDALAEMSARVGSKNLDFVITAVTIQRQVGGSLAGIFDMVADAVRERQQFARKIKGLTAMGRMSAYVLLGLPFFLAGVFTLLNPEYMDPFWHTSTGHMIIATGLVMMTLGSLVLRKMVSFRG